MILKEIPFFERPREKVINQGVKYLSNVELIAILLRTGNNEENVLRLSEKLLYKLHDASIANYKRNKDPETQWFTYTWRFEKEEYVEEITKFYTERLNKREALLDDLENNLYFVCCMDPEHFKGDYAESSEY